MSITRHSIQIDSQGVKQTEAELRALDAADKRVESSLNDVASAANKASASVTKVGAASQSAAKSSSGAVDSIRSGFEKLDGTVSKVMGVTNTLGDVFKLVGMGVGVGALVGGFADIVEVGSQLIDVFDKTGERLQAQVVYYQSLTQSIDAARKAAADLRSEQEKAFSAAYVAGLTATGVGGQAGALAAQIARDTKLREELLDFVAAAAIGDTTAAASGFMPKEQLAEQASARLRASQMREELEARQKAAGLDRLYFDPPPGMAPGAQAGFMETWGAEIAAVRQADEYAKSLDKNTLSLGEAESEIRRLTEVTIENTAALKKITETASPAAPPGPRGAVRPGRQPSLFDTIYGVVGEDYLAIAARQDQEAAAAALEAARTAELKKIADAQTAQTREEEKKTAAIIANADRVRDAAMAAVGLRAGAPVEGGVAAKFLAQAGMSAMAVSESEVMARQNEDGTRSTGQDFKGDRRQDEMIGAVEAINAAYERGYISLSDVKTATEDLFDLYASDDFAAASAAIEELRQSFDTLDMASSDVLENMAFGFKNLGRELAAEASNISGIIASTVGALTNGIGSMMTNLIVAGEAGWSNIKKTIGNALAGISAQAFGYSVLLGALGTASAVGIIGLPAAPGLFAAAGVMFGAGLTLAGMARGFGADQIGAQAGGAKATGGKSGGTQFNGLSPTKPNDQPINVTVVLSDEGVYDGMVRVDRRRAMSGSSRPRMAGAF